MKKYFSLLAAAVFALGFTACEDVPEPYTVNNGTYTPPVDETIVVEESFASKLGSFENYLTSGAGTWAIDYGTAKAAGYDSNTKITTDGTYYLVGPEMDLSNDTAVHVSYDYILRYNKSNANQQLLINTAFDPANPAAGWKLLNETHTEGTDWNTFSAADVQIPTEYLVAGVRIALKYTCSGGNGSTWEVKNLKVARGTVGQTTGGGETPVEGLTGEGTAEKPYTVADALSLLQANAQSTEKVYVAGKVTKIDEISTSYGNGTYYIGDEGANNELEVYRGYGLGGNKFTSASDIKVGDAVVVYGVLVNYNGTFEFTTGSQITSLNGGSTGGGTTVTDGLPYVDANLGTFTAVTPKGIAWNGGGTYSYYKASGYTSASQTYTSTDAWLISPAINCSSAKEAMTLAFQYVVRYGDSTTEEANYAVLITDNYTGDPATTNWTHVTINPTKNTSDWTFQNASVTLPAAFSGKDKVVIAFHYTSGDDQASTATWELKTFSLTVGDSTGGGDNTGGGNTGDDTTLGGLEDFNNGSFEAWSGDYPTGWQSACTASTKGALKQSNDARTGEKSVLLTGAASANRRLASKEMKLEAGTYAITFYAKSAGNGGSCRPGYVPMKADGAVGAYVYGNYVNNLSSEWTEVNYEFTLTEATTVCLVVMNPKSPGTDILIDDYTITKK